MLIETSWLATPEVKRAVREEDMLILTPYKNSITIMLKHGAWLAQAKHDGTDEAGDMEMLKTLCLYRYNNGGQDV